MSTVYGSDCSVLYLGIGEDVVDACSGTMEGYASVDHEVADGPLAEVSGYDAVVVGDVGSLPDSVPEVCDGAGPVVLVLTDDPGSVPLDRVTDYVLEDEEPADALANRLTNYLELRSRGPSLETHEEVPDAVMTLDEDLRFTYLDPYSEEILRGDDLVGERLRDGLQGRLGILLEEGCEEAMETDEPVSLEEYYEPLGRWLRASVEPSDSGSVGGVSVYLRDVTERRTDDADGEDYRRMVEEARDILWMFEPDFSENLVINPAYSMVFGQPKETLESNPTAFVDATHPDDRDLLREKMDEVSSGEPVDFEIRVNREEDYGRWLWVKGHPVYEGGEVSAVAGFARDITERREREDELERYEAFVENSTDVITLLGEDGTFLYNSSSVERVLGNEGGELLGENGFEYVHPDDTERVFETFEELINDGDAETRREEFRFRRSDGTYVWLESRATDMTDTEIGGVIINGRDITERKRREEELEEYETVIEALDDAVYVLDDEGRFEYVNEAFLELTGYDEDSVVGSTPDIIKDEDALARGESKLACLLSDSGPEDVRFEIDIVTRDGERIPCEDHMGVLLDEDGGFRGSAGTLRDISERKERERELRVRTRAMEKADVAFTLSDPSQPDNPLVYVNDAFLELTGYDEDEVLGRNCRFLQGEGTDPKKVDELREAIRNEEPVTVELLNYTKDGDEFWNRLHVSPIRDEDGEVVHYLGSQRDTSELRRKREKLEVLYGAVDDMISATSSVRVRGLVQEAARRLGYEAEYYVWDDDEGALEGIDSGGSVTKGPAWAAYASGEPYLAEDVLAYPVSTDGVLFVSAEEVDREVDALQEFVSSLVASAEAAIDRFETRAEVMDIAEELDEREARLGRIREVDEAIRGMTREIPEQDNRAPIERVVCESLLKVEDWDAVVVSSYEEGEWRVREASDEGFARSVSSACEGERNHVSWCAAEGEPRFVDDVAREPPSDWRRSALDHSYLSAAILPIEYLNETYGVVQVYSEETDSFSGMYKRSLTDAVSMLGYSIASVERGRRSGESVRLSVAVSGVGGPIGRVARETVSKVTVRRCIRSEDGDGYNVYLETGDNPEEVAEAARPSSTEVLDDGSVRLRTGSGGAGILDAVSASDAEVRSLWYDEELSQTVFGILAPSGEGRGVVDAVSEVYPDARVVSHRTETGEEGSTDASVSMEKGVSAAGLTDRQREVLKTAYYEGFFEWPRDSTGEEVADELGVSPPTLHQHLRRAQDKILSEVLDDGRT